MRRAVPRRFVLQVALTAPLLHCRPRDDSGKDSGEDPSFFAETNPDLTALEPITPNEEFYQVSFNPSGVPDPAWVETWTLTFGGLTEAEVSLDLSQLKALGRVETTHTLECIGNRSATSISNAVWAGLLLKDILELSGVAPLTGATHLYVQCGDGYTTSLPMTDLDAGLMLVWEMNGVDLPIEHGAPVRLLVPGRYGMKNPKWITRIDLADTSIPGFWELFGWSDTATYQLHAWIHQPSPGTLISAPLWLVGSAYFGVVPIARVEVSVDDGQTWAEAEITYAAGPNIWVCWRYWWAPSQDGPTVLQVRATAEDGTVQVALEESDSELDGFEGIHTVEVEVN